jgi:hypothetical protein
MTEERKLTPEEVAALRGDLLPAREAMSLLTTDPNAYVSGFDTLPTSPGSDAGTGATDTAGSASQFADLDASGHATDSLTDADRSETITQTDTASSQT